MFGPSPNLCLGAQGITNLQQASAANGRVFEFLGEAEMG